MNQTEFMQALEALDWSIAELVRQLIAAQNLPATPQNKGNMHKTVSRYANGVRSAPSGLSAFLRLAVANHRQGLPCKITDLAT